MKLWLFGAGRRPKHLPGERYLSPYLMGTGEKQGKKRERDQPRNNQQDGERQTTPGNGGRDRVLTQTNSS